MYKNSWNRWHTVMLIYVSFIYMNSLTPAAVSSQESGFLLTKLMAAMEALGWDALWLTEHILRKSAHFVEYAVLGCVMAQAFRAGRTPAAGKCRHWGALVFAIPFIDETIQLFVPGRSGQISDVWLDMLGTAGGILFMACLVLWTGRAGKAGKAR